MKEKRGEMLLLVGGVLMILGMFLTFVSVEGPGGSASFNGSDAEEASPYFIAGGVAIAAAIALFVMKGGTGRKVVAGLTIAVIAFFGVYAAFTDITKVGDLSTGDIEASAGIGLYLAGLAAVIALVGAVLALRDTPEERPATPATAPPAA